jgi:hypothetical protein
LHATIAAWDGTLFLTDRSRGGTWLDGVRLERGVPTPLPVRFTLRLSDALTLTGTTYSERARAGRAPDALLLRRVGNRPEEAYLWVRRRAFLGPERGCLVRTVRADVSARSLCTWLTEGLETLPWAPGDEAR